MTITEGFSGYSAVFSIDGSVVAEGRVNTATMNQAIVDLTSRDSLRWFDGKSSIRDWEFSGDGVWIFNDLAKQKLQNHLITRTPATVACILTLADGTRTLSGDCILTSLVYPLPHDDAATITYTLKGVGALVQSAS